MSSIKSLWTKSNLVEARKGKKFQKRRALGRRELTSDEVDTAEQRSVQNASDSAYSLYR
jgi:hypothetical protein